ncbi:hypothetical protein [Paraburkholderia sediminicola]|uniref:hypothetical protein n=1 Tax=Paraburkholderia sediminicola TaxID=458836 RepID=UPI0038BCF638
MTDAACKYATVLAELAKAGLRVVVSENRDGQLVTVRAARGIHVFTVGAKSRFEAGLLKSPPRRSPAKPKQ